MRTNDFPDISAKASWATPWI